MTKTLNKLLLVTISLTLVVIMLGAYTRLKDAGLGCPDWPGCYGKLLAPIKATAGVEPEKAWIEMIHRYVAGILGLLILILNFLLRKDRWLGLFLISVVIFQALLGMWTVTMRLDPLVVMGHLLGGFSILGLLSWLYFRTSSVKNNFPESIKHHPSTLKKLVWTCLILLIAQIALGGWVSANYAALVCADLPTCQGHWWPPMDWSNAFSHGNILENPARVTIQMAHRLGALVTAIFLLILSFRIYSLPLFCLLAIQLTLGITNVLGGLPLIVSVLHNAVAALLLVCLVQILSRLYAK